MMITRDDLQLRILSCMSMEGSGIVKYRDDVNKISAVTITPRKDELSYGKPKTTYYIFSVFPSPVAVPYRCMRKAAQ